MLKSEELSSSPAGAGQVVGLLLAGGKSRRMGTDKCLLECEGVPLWGRQLQTLRQAGCKTLAVAAPKRPAWIPDGVSWIPDADLGGEGAPICGVLAGLRWAGEVAGDGGLLLVLAVDVPRMEAGFLRELLELHGGVPWNERDGGSGFEPLAACYPVGVLPAFEDWVRNGHRGFQPLLADLVEKDQLRQVPVPIAKSGLFLNWNHPKNLRGSEPQS